MGWAAGIEGGSSWPEISNIEVINLFYEIINRNIIRDRSSSDGSWRQSSSNRNSLRWSCSRGSWGGWSTTA